MDHAHGGALARAVRTEEAEAFALVDAEADAVHRAELIVVLYELLRHHHLAHARK